MSERISFGKNTPHALKESIYFDAVCPYRIRYKEFLNDDITPLHYADTFEIAVCCGVDGNVGIEHRNLKMQGNCVYLIPPGMVHASTILKGAGHVYLLHVSPEALQPLIGLPAIFNLCNKQLVGFCSPEPFEQARKLICEMIDKDESAFSRLRALLELFEVLIAELPEKADVKRHEISTYDISLRMVLSWTEAHFAEQISLGQVAAIAGFTPNYFCTWFKSGTGWTYKTYLTNLRISHACQILRQSGSLTEACYHSGFQDMGHFIQTFKRTQGCTPGGYLRNFDHRA